MAADAAIVTAMTAVKAAAAQRLKFMRANDISFLLRRGMRKLNVRSVCMKTLPRAAGVVKRQKDFENNVARAYRLRGHS